MMRAIFFSAVLSGALTAQTASYPLESVAVTGTAYPKEMVVRMAGLRTGMLLNKAAIEQACGKLQASGFFQSVTYHYGPAPKGGYALTLTIADDPSVVDAVVDIPGIDEEEVWRWLEAKYPPLRHKVPRSDAAEQTIAADIRQHLASELDGQQLVTRIEGLSGKTTVIFEPERLPRVASMSFTGNHELSSAQLLAAMDKVNAEQEYTDRRFRAYVDLNLRRAYEEHGMYKVRFPSISSKKAGDHGVDVSVAIDEGPQYTLGAIHIIGADVPENEMLKAANFKIGQVANWTDIQNSVWAMEKPVKRTGYFEAAVTPERVFDDQRHVLDLNLTVRKGPLYTFGELDIVGLSSDLAAKAHQLWRVHPGDPYDYEYPNEFVAQFLRTANLREFRTHQVTVTKKPGNVMDVTLKFGGGTGH